LGVVEAVAAEWVDLGAPDRGEPGERGVVGHELGVRGGEVLQGGGGVAGVPDEDGVDEQPQAEGVAVVVVLVSGKLGAGADDDVAEQGRAASRPC
jgi:hypothetical protein